MSAPNDGGPAFPNSNGHDNPNFPEGMSLRDYFAAKVMAAYISAPDEYGTRARENAKMVAGWSYFQADAMLAQRSISTEATP